MHVPVGRRLAVCFLLVVVLTALPASLQAEDPTPQRAEKLLRHASHTERIAGLEMFAALPPTERAERLVIKALEDPDWEVQSKAAAVLAKIGKDAARKALVRQAVRGEVQQVRLAATEALKSLDQERAATRLAELGKKEREDVYRARALEAAGSLAGPEQLKKLRGLTRHKSPPVAAAAVRALGRLMQFEDVREEVRETLVKVLKGRDDKHEFFSYIAALEALGASDNEATRTLLVDELILQPDEDGYAPERIARVLQPMDAAGVAAALTAGFARAGKPEALRRLLRMVGRVRATAVREAVEQQLAHKVASVRSAAVCTLGQLREAASKEPLLKALDDKDFYVQVEAVTALSRVLPPAAFRELAARIRELREFGPRLQFVVDVTETDDPELGVQALALYLDDDNWRVASAAAASVGTLGIDKDLHYLEPLAKSKDWRLRGAAYEGMGRLRAKNAMPLLIEGLKDKDPVVRGVCGTNLQILARKRFPPDHGLWWEWWHNNKRDFSIRKRSRMTEKDLEEEAEQKKRDGRYAKPREYNKDPREWGVEILQKARILVISGAWDKVEIVLDHLNIKHTLLRAQELKDVGLNPNQIVLVNCEGNMDKKTRERVRWFVNVGGYLMSTDWALTKAVGDSFPGYLEQFARASTGNDVVVVEEARPGHALTKGVFLDVPALKWWLEIQAFPISVVYPERCHVLVDSAEMRQKYGSSPMAAVFQWGLGKVQHSVSHFYLQEEGMQHVRDPRQRMVFARDHLGISLAQIRKMAKRKAFDGSLTEATMREIAPDYSMFRLIVNMVKEKSDWVEKL